MGGRGGGPCHEVGDTRWEAVGGLVGLQNTWTGTLRFAYACIWGDGFQQTLKDPKPKKDEKPWCRLLFYTSAVGPFVG